MNLANKEFPLRTSYELKRILTIYNGSNDIEVISDFSYYEARIKYSFFVNKVFNKTQTNYTLKSKPPFGYVIRKGYTNVVIHRRFVDYALNDPFAKDLLIWTQDTWAPEEWLSFFLKMLYFLKILLVLVTNVYGIVAPKKLVLSHNCVLNIFFAHSAGYWN